MQIYVPCRCGGQRTNAEVKAKLASGQQPVFDNVDALFDALESD